jgi:membrane peptidoglycan carboxypeptidase
MTDSTQRPRKKSSNSFTTKSGKTIKVNRTLNERMRASREAKAQRKAAYLSTLPKEPWKRALHRMHPKRLYKYWFSREGGIMALKITGIGLVAGFLLIVGLFAYFRKDLPKIRDLNSGNSGGSIAYYDRTGQNLLFQDYDTFKRIPLNNVNDISPYMRQATIAIEDKDFYHEGAFNVKGITRAAVNNLKGGSTQGGSTITQQLVKINENWTNDHTVSRKVKELILAVELEREYSKDDILTAYLNAAPYSGLDSGVQAAAQDMFGVDAKNLTLAQATMLAAIPKQPGNLSPYSSPTLNPSATSDLFDKDALVLRQHYILDLMVKQGYITQAQATQAKAIDIVATVHERPNSHYAGIKYPYFVLAAREEIQKDFPASVVSTGGLKVVTTLDVNLQNLAEKSLSDGMAQLRRQQADNAAFVAEDNETGQVVALIGGVDFDNSYGKINYATDVNISPGSSVKPYDYTNFINNNTNVGAGSVLYDQVGALPVTGYQCTNKSLPSADPSNSNGANCLYDYDRSSRGPITLRYAMGASLNIPAVKSVISSVPGDTTYERLKSVEKMRSTASALMGVSDGYRCYNTEVEDFFSVTKEDETHCTASSAIGDGAYLYLKDHVNGIASLAREGKVVPQTFLLKVSKNSGKILKQFEQPKSQQVVKADSAYIVDNMAADPNASYLSGSCNTTTCSGMKFHRYKGWTNAIKTGTTNYSYDGLMMSWNPKYSAGIWVGNHTRTVAYTGSPEYMTDPIMKEFMQGAIDNLGADAKAQQFVQPSDIKTLPSYVYTKRYAGQVVPSPSTDIFPSWYVGKTTASSATLDKVSGKIATSCTPAAAKQTSNNGNVASWNVDIFMGGNPSTTASSSTSSQGSDDVHSCSDNPPTATITAVNGKSTSGDVSCPNTGTCSLLVHVEQGTHELTDSQYAEYPGTLSIIISGQTVQSQQINDSGDYSVTFTMPDGLSGSVQVQAQITDSVLYQGSDTQTITLSDTNKKTSFAPTTSGGPGNAGTLASTKNGIVLPKKK